MQGLLLKRSQGVSETLRHLLADECHLYVKMINYRWNTVGPYQYGIGKLLEEQYHQISGIIDEIVEQAHLLGIEVTEEPVTMNWDSRAAAIGQDSAEVSEPLPSLLADHKAMLDELKTSLDQTSTSDGTNISDLLRRAIKTHVVMAGTLEVILGEGPPLLGCPWFSLN